MDATCLPPEPWPLQGSKSSMKCSVEEILAAFASQDVSNLEEETLYNFLKLFPTNDQMGRFGASTIDPSLSKTVVELYVKMIQMPFVDKILEVALFKVPFSHRVSQLSKDLHLLHQLSKEAKRSAKLGKVLDMIPSSHFFHPAPPPPPSFSNPMFQVLPDRANRSKRPPSPPLPPTPPPTRASSHSNLQIYSEQHAAAALQRLKEVKPQTKDPMLPPPPPPPPLPLPPRAHLVWRTEFVEALESSPHYTWEVQAGAPAVNPVDMKQGSCPAPPPPPSSWNSWAPKCGTYQRVARRHEAKELAVIANQLKKTEDGIHASRIAYGHAKLKAAGHKKSKIMLELCRTLSKQSPNLMEFCIENEIPCLKDAAGAEVQSWRNCQRELLHLRTEFDKAIVLWKTSIRKCVDAKSTRDMLDAFFWKGEQDLVDLSKFIREVESSTGNLLYHLEADKHKRRHGYLDEDEPIVSIFLKFVECFKATAADLELEKQRALQLPKVNLLDAIFSSENSGLDVDHLINLISFCPSKVQLDMFKNLVKEEGSANRAQEKLSALLTAPKIHGKLKLLSIKRNLPAQAEKLRFRLTNLIEAAKEIMQSVELNRVVGVLALLWPTHSNGPFAPKDETDQAASSRTSDNCTGGSDEQVSSSSGIDVPRLYQLRSKTLMELVKYIAEKHPELLEFYKSLPHLESGTNAAGDLLGIADEISALARSVEEVESELKDLQSEADISADGASDAQSDPSSTMSLWKSFLHEAEAEYQAVLKVWRDARSSSTELVDFFHENRILFRVQDGLSAIQSFVKRFQQAAEAFASEEKEAEETDCSESERTAAGQDTEEDHGVKNEASGIEVPEEEKEQPSPKIHQIFVV